MGGRSTIFILGATLCLLRGTQLKAQLREETKKEFLAVGLQGLIACFVGFWNKSIYATKQKKSKEQVT